MQNSLVSKWMSALSSNVGNSRKPIMVYTAFVVLIAASLNFQRRCYKDLK